MCVCLCIVKCKGVKVATFAYLCAYLCKLLN